MKIVITAMALVFALPAAAQTAPAPQQHQDHQQHQAAQPGQHQAAPQGLHGQHQPSQHQGHAMQDGCCADRNNNGIVDQADLVLWKGHGARQGESGGHQNQ